MALIDISDQLARQYDALGYHSLAKHWVRTGLTAITAILAEDQDEAHRTKLLMKQADFSELGARAALEVSPYSNFPQE